METCRSYGRTGSTTGTNVENDTNSFHGNATSNGRYRGRICSSVDEEQRPGETLQEYLDRHEALNGNTCHSSSRSTFRSGSELTSESDFMDERRNSNQSDTDVFLPSPQPEINEQRRILDQKRRELPPGHRSSKRVADYVNGLPIIPEPPAQEGVQSKGNIGQVKRQRIWSEGHERRRRFTESGSLSFAEGMTPQKHAASTSSSNLSMLSSLSSQSGSYAWFESGEDFDKTLLPWPEEPSSQPLPQQQPPSPRPMPTTEQMEQPTVGKHGWNDNYHTMRAVKLPPKPKGPAKEQAFPGSSLKSPSQWTRSSTTEGSAPTHETLPTPNKDKPLHRRMTNSDLIALATQHRQQHTTHRRRQNLLQMGTSNVSDSSDTDTSGQSYSSIDDLLIARHDPEEILLNLGFGGSPETDVLDRIPSRFLQKQSQARGISTHQFLSQMDELERGCGFSLVGGLRSLGSALRRSSRMSLSPTPPNITNKSVKVASEPQQKEPVKTEPHNVLPDDLNHNVETAVKSIEVIAETGRRVKGHRKLVQQSRVGDIVLTPVVESHQVCCETLRSEGQRVEVVTGSRRDVMPHRSASDRHNPSTTLKLQSGSAKLDKRTEREVGDEPSEARSPVREFNQEKGSVLKPRISQLSNTHSGAATGRGLQSREDSFEFEELSSEERLEDANGAIHTGEAALNNQGNLSRSDSTQSDSSGFADENIGCNEMDSPKSTSDDNTTITSDSKITQTSFDANTIELLDSGTATSHKITALTLSQESSQSLPSVTSLEDSPFDDAIVVTELPTSNSQRTRRCTYPATLDRRVEESGPKTVVEILSSLHTTSKELGKEDSKQGLPGPTRRKPPKLMKMKSVDPEGYGFKCTVESRGVQTQVEATVNALHERSCEVLHEVDEDILGQDGLSDGNVDHETKDDRPVQSVEEYSIPDGPCAQHVVEKCSAAIEKNCEEVCEGSEAAPIESKIIPICRSHEAHERLSIVPSHSTECLPVKSEQTSENEHQVRCDNIEINPAIPVVSESNIVQLSSQVTNKSLSENLSTCIKENISSIEHRSCDGAIVDGEEKGCWIERTLSEINLCEISSQTSSTVTDDVGTSLIKCQWERKLPFSVYSSSEFEVEDYEINRELDLNEMLKNKILDQQKDVEEVIHPVENEVFKTSSTFETSAISVVASNEVSSVEDIRHHSASSGETEQPITTQDTKSHDTMLPTESAEPSFALSEHLPHFDDTHPSTAQSTAPLDLVTSSAPNPSQDAVSDGRSENLEATSSEVKEGAVDVPKVPQQSFLEDASQPLSDCSKDTRIEMISKEEHCKAREELKALLSTQDYPSSSPLKSARSANHDEAVEDLKLLQRALGRYDRDLEELESWSSKLFQEVGFALSPEERSDLQSLSSVRHKIKDEIQSLEKNLLEKFQAVISRDTEHETKEESLWSPGLSQVMCQMVDLLKEQTSLRSFLDDLQALEYSTSPIPAWSARASSPKRRNLLADATHGGSVDESDDGNRSEGEADLTDEVASACGDLPFPQTLSQGELIEELQKAQSDLKKMKAQAKQDVVMAVREAKDIEIENLRSMVRELKETSLTMSGFETFFRQMARDKES
ncbi:uncharacterized protein LOC575011 isoform X2 [Strongylocentrotus purpuratus]|uniref:ITPR-interacting domain-containing protein n=1 Tax=Strongylocentrotus purpuratus TaxID=7668 RepID=A0A7M7N3V0_STRPU|nr:uncharacterized protein LOC575011 isoform X2 [Strongylocentrotus purpuratus]